MQFLQVADGLESINFLRYTIIALMVVEGAVVCLVVTGYVLYQLRALTQHRKALFTVFLAIPNPFLRNLASKSVNIEDEESDNEGEQDGGLNVFAVAFPLMCMSCDSHPMHACFCYSGWAAAH